MKNSEFEVHKMLVGLSILAFKEETEPYIAIIKVKNGVISFGIKSVRERKIVMTKFESLFRLFGSDKYSGYTPSDCWLSESLHKVINRCEQRGVDCSIRVFINHSEKIKVYPKRGYFSLYGKTSYIIDREDTLSGEEDKILSKI